jgi:hypothetical protein
MTIHQPQKRMQCDLAIFASAAYLLYNIQSGTPNLASAYMIGCYRTMNLFHIVLKCTSCVSCSSMQTQTVYQIYIENGAFHKLTENTDNKENENF